MTKRLSFLSGLASLTVVLAHSVYWGYTAMFWLTDRYSPVSVPNWDQTGALAYFALAAMKRLAIFAIPAFLYTSSFIIAYAARGQSTLTWRVVRKRLSSN